MVNFSAALKRVKVNKSIFIFLHNYFVNLHWDFEFSCLIYYYRSCIFWTKKYIDKSQFIWLTYDAACLACFVILIIWILSIFNLCFFLARKFENIWDRFIKLILFIKGVNSKGKILYITFFYVNVRHINFNEFFEICNFEFNSCLLKVVVIFCWINFNSDYTGVYFFCRILRCFLT